MRKQRVFISSVMRDYYDRRDAVAAAVQGVGMEPVLAETMEASGGTPRYVVLNEVIGGCQAVIGIYSSRYGWAGARSVLSPTEEEYDRARELYKPVYAFIDGMENGKVEPRQQAFLEKVQNWDVGVFRREFHSLNQLQKLVQEALTGRNLSPRYRRFLDQLVGQTRNISGLTFREEAVPAVPGFDLVLHAPSSQFTAGVESYIIVIDGDYYDREASGHAIRNWCEELNRLIGAGFWKAKGASTSVVIAIETNPYGYHERNLVRNRGVFKADNYDEMLVDMVSGAIELPSGNKPWINPIKQAVESAL